MELLTSVTARISDMVWGTPLLVLLVGTGILFTLRLGALQITKLPLALKLTFTKEEGAEGDVSHFAALCTALAATIGTGNIVGVATAIKAGGPGALFWMWMAALFGMATKYAEGVLAVKYRIVDDNGQMAGGPMYYLERGLGQKWLAVMFSVFGIGVACLGIGTFAQVNSIADAVRITFGVPVWITGLVVAALTAGVTLGGIKSISRVSEIIVPFMAVSYMVAVAFILMRNASAVPDTLALVFKHAFTPAAAVGGFAGAAIKTAIQKGVSRGVFSNESGLGSAPIAAAAAQTRWAARQGLVSMTGTFIDTILVCTATGLTLLFTGVWKEPGLAGAAMTNAAFDIGLPGVGPYLVTIGLIFFAFTTILGWNYYGERCAVYLFGVKSIMPYRLIYIFLVAIGAGMKLMFIWNVADIVNGLMAIPNLIGLIGLSGVVVEETNRFLADHRQQGKNRANNGRAIEAAD